MSAPRLGDFGDSARDRGLIDTRLCTHCAHGYRQAGGDIDCRHQPHRNETTEARAVRNWLLGKLGGVPCPMFEEI